MTMRKSEKAYWVKRAQWVSRQKNPTLYVTPEEYEMLRSDASPLGELEVFNGVPVSVGRAYAVRQRDQYRLRSA